MARDFGFWILREDSGLGRIFVDMGGILGYFEDERINSFF